jgi:hypothetical protein
MQDHKAKRKPKAKRAGGVAHLRKCEALSSNPVLHCQKKKS